MVNVLAFILLALLGNPAHSEVDYELEVKISGIQKKKGQIRIAIYSTSNEFPSSDDIMDFRIIPVDSEVVTCTFVVTELGNYAMALVHDINSNGVMDYNFVGYPKEPYAFSNNPGIWYRAPTFQECAIKVDGKKSIEIKMK